MSKSPAPAAPTERERVVRRLAGIVALSVAAQAAAFIALQWIERWCARLVLDAIARATQGAGAPAADVAVEVVLLVLELLTALVVGYVAARRLLRAIVRATPHPMRPPLRPIPWAALCAGGIAAAASLLTFASSEQSLTLPAYAWLFEALRDAAVIALFWFAAMRVLAAAKTR